MALCNILLSYAMDQSEVQEFHDVTRDVTTTTAELLTLAIESVREIEMVKP